MEDQTDQTPDTPDEPAEKPKKKQRIVARRVRRNKPTLVQLPSGKWVEEK
jgi:hypothetical protein